MELEMVIEGFAIRLVRRGERLIARPQAEEGARAEIDVAKLIEEERDRRPGWVSAELVKEMQEG